jgi:hypothetical protein
VNAVRTTQQIRHALLEALVPELDSGSSEQVARALTALAETLGMLCVSSADGSPEEISAMLDVAGSLASQHANAFLMTWRASNLH